VKSLVSVFIAALLVALSPTTASACLVTSFESVKKASDVIVEGRYFGDPDDEASGHIEPTLVERGEQRDHYQVRWSIDLLEDPNRGQCATQIPSNGHYGRFYLRSRDAGNFHMIGRAWVKDPDAPEETDD
jgi:hypothetical protein